MSFRSTERQTPFRALKRGERKRSKLDVTYDYGDGKRIEFSGPEPLGADDLRILQGLVAMAGPNGLVLGPEPKTEGGRQLRLFLEPKWEAVTADAMVVKGSYRALAKEIGAEVDSGGALKHIQDCIERLWKVSIIAQNGRKRQGFRLRQRRGGRAPVRGPEPLDRAGRHGWRPACAHQHGRGAGAGQRNRPPAAPAAVWLDRPRQNRQGFHRYLVRLCLAVRGQWFDHAQAPPAGARGVAGAGRAGLDGNRVRGGQVRHHPAQGGRLTPPLYCKQDIFIFYIQWLIFLLIGNTMKNTMLRKGLTIF